MTCYIMAPKAHENLTFASKKDAKESCDVTNA